MLYNGQIDEKGFQYIYGTLEETKYNKKGLPHKTKAFDVLLNHNKQRTVISTFRWINGIPRRIKTVMIVENKILSISEIEQVLKDLNLLPN